MAYTHRIVYLLIALFLLLGHEPLYLAREVGYFGSDAAHLVKCMSTSQVIHAYRDNVIQAAGVTLDETLLVNQYSGPAKLARLLSANAEHRLNPGF